MQFPESWLRSYCNPDITSSELADVLTMGGLEVEEMHPVAPPFSGIVVGEIKEAVQHPNADRLRVCQVDIGSGELLNIVCGAPNARVGIRVPVATVGALLPADDNSKDGKPFKIKVGKLRGVESYGMLCSARELGISEDHGGLMELPPSAPIGKNVREVLNLDEMIIILKLTPNLAHCASVYGVAREVSALTGAPLKPLTFTAQKVTTNAVQPVEVLATDLCGRFSGRVMQNLNLQVQTPAWMVQRLERCGQRSVSPLVDVSNYVMFELGRPSHIFDADKIHGGLQVRWAVKGETLKLLNGNTVTLDEQVGVIADDNGVESLAGIMGGEASAVSDTTRNIYIEAAFWWPQAVAGRSRRFGFSTDAGYRFERGVDPSTTVDHIEYITQLLLEICGSAQTRCGAITDTSPNLPRRDPVTLRVERASKIIGMPVTQAECAQAFTRLSLPFTEKPGELTVTPPSWRFDMQYEADLIEEVARLIGYERLPVSTPLAPIFARTTSETERTPMHVRHVLAQLGYLETINFSFVPRQWEEELVGNADPIKVLNPIASDLEVMRSSLLPSLIQVLRQNAGRHAQRVQVFELGHVFQRDAAVESTDTTVKGIAQPRMLAGLIYGDRAPLQWAQKPEQVDFYDAKADVEALLAPWKAEFVPAAHPALHPWRCAHVLLGGQVVGVVGELHPKWRQQFDLPHAPVLFELAFEAVRYGRLPQHVPVSRFPAVLRDVAFVVPESVTCAQLTQALQQGARNNGILRQITLFDVYRPKPGSAATEEMPQGHKSMAFRLELVDEKATLTDEHVNRVVAEVVQAAQQTCGARLRR